MPLPAPSLTNLSCLSFCPSYSAPFLFFIFPGVIPSPLPSPSLAVHVVSFLLLHCLLIHQKITSSCRLHPLQCVQTLLGCSFSWQGDMLSPRTCQGMLTSFLEAFSKTPSRSEPPEQSALLLGLLLSSAAAPWALCIPAGRISSALAQDRLECCALMLVQVAGPSLAQPGQCWCKEQEPGMLWVLQGWEIATWGWGNVSRQGQGQGQGH